MRSYFLVRLGEAAVHANACLAGDFIGTDFGIHEDLTGRLPDELRAFNKEFIPVYLEIHPEKTRPGAGLACGFLWTVSKGIQEGDIVLSPDGSGRYRVGEVAGGYYYAPGEVLFHRRPVRWLDVVIDRSDMSEALSSSVRFSGTVCSLSRGGHAEEIDALMGGAVPPNIVSTDETVEDPLAFALEKHLEDFLVANWSHTELGRDYDIYEEDGKLAGQQYLTDTGPLDILAVSKDRRTLLVVELKKGRVSDAVVGQVLRYMGYVKEALAESGQAVKGAVIAFDDDLRIQRALAMSDGVEFYRYEVSFKLVKS